MEAPYSFNEEKMPTNNINNRKRCPDKERGGGFLLLSGQGSVKAVDKAISSYLGITVNKYYLVNIHISW